MESNKLNKSIIIYNCPVCNKTARAIDKLEDADCADLVRCDIGQNEYYSCFVSEQNSNLRFIARRSKPIKPNFEKQPASLKLQYHKEALTL